MCARCSLYLIPNAVKLNELLSLGTHKNVRVNSKAIIKNYYNQITHFALKTKGKDAHIQIDKCSRKMRTLSRMNSSFADRWSFSYPN